MPRITQQQLAAGFLEYAVEDFRLPGRTPGTPAYAEAVARLVTAAGEAITALGLRGSSAAEPSDGSHGACPRAGACAEAAATLAAAAPASPPSASEEAPTSTSARR